MIITQIENAIIARGNAVNSVANFGALLKTVGRWSGEFASEDLQALIDMAPFVLVSHTRSVPRLVSVTGAQWLGEFTLICGSTSRRSRAQAMASRVGGPAAIELGSRQIAELMRDILAGQNFGLPIGMFEPVGLDEIYSGQAGGSGSENFLSITGLQVSTTYSTTRSTVADGPSDGLAQIVGTFAAMFGADPIGSAEDTAVSTTVTLPLPQEEQS